MLAGRSAALAAMLLFAHAGLAQGTSKPATPTRLDQSTPPVLSAKPTQADVLRAKAMELERLKAQEVASVKPAAREESRGRDGRASSDAPSVRLSVDTARPTIQFGVASKDFIAQGEFRGGNDRGRRDEGRDDDHGRRGGPEWSHAVWRGHEHDRGVVNVRYDGRGHDGAPGCYSPLAVYTECIMIEGRRIEATLTLWADPRCGDLKGKVRLTTADPRGLPALAVSLNANQGRKNTWYPELDRLSCSTRSSMEWETIGSPDWAVDCMRARLIITSSCGAQEIEWRDVRVPGAH